MRIDTEGYRLFGANGDPIHVGDTPSVKGIWFNKVAGMTHRVSSAKAVAPRKTQSFPAPIPLRWRSATQGKAGS
jgi:hypothetical protein